jgi:chorismate mutase
MPPNNKSNSTSALSRQMQRLRRQVDQIDLKMLRLLQQRTRLSGRIGLMKQRHGAAIYVPDRERALVSRLTRLSKGRLPARAVAALYREIMSSSRSAQGQTPIGFLQASAPVILPASGACFGACDQFSPRKTWSELAKDLQSGALSLALLTGNDLAAALASARWRSEFLIHFLVTGDFSAPHETKAPLDRRIFIVTPRVAFATSQANRIVILIECKSTLNAIKSLLQSMPETPIHAEQMTPRASLSGRKNSTSLVHLATARPMDANRAASSLLQAGKAAGIPVSILGIYPGTEDYGG